MTLLSVNSVRVADARKAPPGRR